MRSDVSRIGHGRFVVSVDGKDLQNLVEHLAGIPTGELGVNRLPRAEALGQIAPRYARLGDVEDSVDEQPVGELGWTCFSAALGWQQRLNAFPLLVAQLVTSHIQT
jgi:hypothetical protein